MPAGALTHRNGLPNTMSKPVYFSICSSNYLAYARTLAASLRSADPEATFVLFLADEVGGAYDAGRLGFEVIEAREIGIPCFADMAFRYDVMEFNTAIKPFCIRYLFDERRADAAVYLDPDLYVLRPLVDVEAALAGGADIVLTPHATAPLDDGGDPDDIRIMRTGAYNLGFGAFANTAPARALVAWWAKHLQGDCVVDLEAGLFVDQKFMDLAPCLVESAKILRHPGYNAAYWNLMHRPVTRAGAGWLAGGVPLHFFHFSGVVPGDHDVFSKHQNRYTARNIGELQGLLHEYLDRLESNDRLDGTRFSRIPYHYDRFLDGTPIPKEFRLIYRRHHQPGLATPYAAVFTPNLGLYQQPVPGLGAPGEPAITLVMHQVWAQRSDLQLAFNLEVAEDRWRFAEWFVGSGRSECRKLPAAVFDRVEAALQAARAARGAEGGGGAAPAVPKGGVRKRLSRFALQAAPRLRPFWSRLPGGVREAVKRQLVGGAGLPMLAQGVVAGRPVRRVSGAVARYRDPNLEHGISLFGYLRTESGVGEGARRAAKAIEAAGIPYAGHALGTGGVFEDAVDTRGLRLADGASPYAVAVMHVNADQTVHLPKVIDERLLRGKHRVGYWAWELAGFPDAWLTAFDQVDEIWTPSEFVAYAVRQRTEKPVRVMPHPVPLPAASRFDRAHFGLPADVPLLLSTFDLNSYFQRKNPQAAVAAYLDAFPDPKSDTPHLVLKMHGRLNRGEQIDAMFQRISDDPRIHVIDRVLDRDELTGLQQATDAFISLHRSEGFGLNIAECMAAGKLAIATAYGGNTDFCDETNGLPVGFSMIRVQEGEYPHPQGQWWAEPSHEDAVAAIRAAFSGDPAIASRAAKGREDLRANNSDEAIGRRVAQALGGR